MLRAVDGDTPSLPNIHSDVKDRPPPRAPRRRH